MKSGEYKVSFNVILADCASEEDARDSIENMVRETISDGDFPEIELEFVEELDSE